MKKEILAKIEEYTADSQVALTDVEHLYHRPALIFGGERSDESYPYSSQKTVALREILDNGIGEIEVGVANRLEITFYKDNSIEVLENGRGMPFDESTDAYGNRISGLYKSMGLLKSGQSLGKTQKGKFVTSLNGVGGSSTQYMSEFFKIEVYRKNKIYKLDFKDGSFGIFNDDEFTEFTDKTKIVVEKDTRDEAFKKLYPHGTKIHFKLNDVRFSSPYGVDKDDIKLRIMRASYLFPKTTFIINEETEDGFNKTEYYSDEGLNGLVDLQLKTDRLIAPIIFKGETAFRVNNNKKSKIDKKIKGNDLYGAIQKTYKEGDTLEDERELLYDFSFGYNSDYDTNVDAFTNSIRNTFGGVHVDAVQKAMLSSFNTKFRSMKSGLSKNDKDVIWADIEKGLIYTISVKTNEPEFNGQEKLLLSSKELQNALKQDLEEQLEKWLNKASNRETVELLATKIITEMKNRTNIEHQQDVNREKNKITKNKTLPSKLVDCEFTYEPYSTLYITEGDSALSGLKVVRDSRFAALFPIRGKILNVRKASSKEILANKEVQDIIKCLQTDIGDKCIVENCRYQNVIIASDPDIDGASISNLIITLFWELFPDFIKKGRLFRMMTPLYEVVVNDKEYYYCMNMEEKLDVERQLKEQGKKIKEIKRFKGLGESGAKVLKETGMDLKTRRLQQITLTDIKKAEEIIELVSGEDADIRKDWMVNNPYSPEIVEIDNE